MRLLAMRIATAVGRSLLPLVRAKAEDEGVAEAARSSVGAVLVRFTCATRFHFARCSLRNASLLRLALGAAGAAVSAGSVPAAG